MLDEERGGAKRPKGLLDSPASDEAALRLAKAAGIERSMAVERAKRSPSRQKLAKLIHARSELLSQLPFRPKTIHSVVQRVANELGKLRQGPAASPEDDRGIGLRLGGDWEALDHIRPPLMCAWGRFFAGRMELVEANLPLVVFLARRYAYHRLPYSDLIQEGNLGMIQAAERYDPRFGVRFATYAGLWVRQAMRRATHTQGAIVRLPAALDGAVLRASYEERRMRHELAAEPKLEEVATRADCNVERLRTALAARAGAVSLDASTRDEPGSASRLDFLVAPQQLDPDDAASEHERRRIISSVIDTLKPREQLVLRLHYGLDGARPQRLSDIGRVIHVTRERTRQIEAAALRKLRNRLRPYGLEA